MVIAYDNETPLEIELTAKNLTCRCPINGLQDCFDVLVRYVPATKLIELGWLRYYLDAFAETPITHEKFTADLLDALVELVVPSYIHVTTTWAPVEGIGCSVRAVAGE